MPTPLYLNADGTLSNNPPQLAESHTTYTFDPKHPVPTIGGNISSNQGLITNGGYDQRPRDNTHAADNRLPLSERRDVLVFRNRPARGRPGSYRHGRGQALGRLDAPDTDFTAKLIDEIPPNADYPLGFDLNLGDSILRDPVPRGARPPGRPADPSDIVPITITLYPTANVFKKGHRIRVDISSSNYPRFDVNPNTSDPLGEYRRHGPGRQHDLSRRQRSRRSVSMCRSSPGVRRRNERCCARSFAQIPCHTVSATPARWLTTRAKTNNKSLRRLR